MYTDKGGASAVLAAFRGMVDAGFKVNVTCTIPLAENSVSSNSYRPSDIIKSYKGLTVEVTNTDAEGRLILCDAMSWTQKRHDGNLRTLIELSTLTGAIMVGLGDKVAGIFSNDKDLVDTIAESGLNVGELFWHMPILDHKREDMKGKNSDLVNSSGVRYGGAQEGAAFLENFVEDGVKWAHLDIAGPGRVNKPYNMHDKSVVGSGFGATSLLETMRKLQSK